MKLSRDSEKLLYLISLYTRSEREMEKWIKNYALWALIYHGIVEKVFEDYDYTPVTVIWYGTLRIANISMEAEADIFKLRREGLINKLRLATSKYRYITAYKITEKGEKYLQNIKPEVKAEVDRVFNPPSVGIPDITIDAKGNPILIYKNGKKILVKILYPEDMAYSSAPSFL
ncbi:MAG: hypothetical protein DRJ38_08390 [Thermoprotei archaeon]|nr:MAG: hypothetical protein DRJ38_08390 [Thermoprotei archaeon]